MRRWHTKPNSFRKLRSSGLRVATILDVGAQTDTKELREAFQDLPHILFEPIADYYPALRAQYAGCEFEIVEAALSDREGTLHLKEIRADPHSGAVSHVVRVDAAAGDNVRSVPMMSLDRFVALRQPKKPYLIKIDVDGPETDVMAGAVESLKDCSCLVVEATMPRLKHICVLAEAAGMRLWDIVDMNYYVGCLYQVDLIFVKTDAIAANAELDPYESINRGFDPASWYEHPG